MNSLHVLFAPSEREKGSLLIVAVLVLAAVTILGVMSTKTAVVETQIAAFDKMFKQTWSVTDGTDNMLMLKVIELGNANGSRTVEFGQVNAANEATMGFNLSSYDDDDGMGESAGYLIRQPANDCALDNVDEEDITNNSARLENSDGTDVLLKIYSTARPARGSALQQHEGYAGIGRSGGSGGVIRSYTIRGLGRIGSEAHGGRHKHITVYNYPIW